MHLLKLIKRRPVVFVLAIFTAVAMVIISEVTYWKSVHSLNAMTATGVARTDIQSLRQNILAAQTAQRSYLLTERREYLMPYGKAQSDLQTSFTFLHERYKDDPVATALLYRLQSVTGELLAQLAQTVLQHDTGQRMALVGNDVLQMGTIQEISDLLLDLESAHIEANQSDVYHTLILNRLGVALLSAISLLALIMYLRQSFVLAHQQQSVQYLMQSERDRLELEVSQRTAQLTELTNYLQTAREDERHRLARNLHDDLGALLTSAKLDAARIRSRLSGAGPIPESLELLAHLVDTLNSGIELGRRIIEDLRPSALSNLGLVAALEILVGEFAAHTGVNIYSTLEHVALEDDEELMVYRLVQEALTNITKHAHAAHVWVTLGTKEGQVEVSVRDDGAGFDTRIKPTSAYGLVGMRFRVEAEGGELNVLSTPGQGTQIQMRLVAADYLLTQAADFD
jgi:signal transduction histidine kinase